MKFRFFSHERSSGNYVIMLTYVQFGKDFLSLSELKCDSNVHIMENAVCRDNMKPHNVKLVCNVEWCSVSVKLDTEALWWYGSSHVCYIYCKKCVPGLLRKADRSLCYKCRSAMSSKRLECMQVICLCDWSRAHTILLGYEAMMLSQWLSLSNYWPYRPVAGDLLDWCLVIHSVT